MELFSAEAESIRKRVEEWLGHPDTELEATFGASGQVDAVTFLAIAQRLRAKGFAPLPQEDRMTVTTPEHVRFSLSSLAVIQAYCRDDTMAGKPFVAIIKDRATADAQVDLEDYDTRVKTRKEVPMATEDATLKGVLAAWPQQRKAFRVIRRWSFDGDGVRVDMSIVRSTAKDARGNFRWQRAFKDQDVMQSQPVYEVEVELARKEGDTVETAMKRLIRGVGEVLRGIQKHTLLIRKSTRAKVLAGYKELTGTDLFRGPAPKTLLKQNFMPDREPGVPNLRDGFNVTDKADGLRCLGYCDKRGELFLIDMGFNVYRTGLMQPTCRESLVDGEWVTRTNDRPAKPMQQYLAFDIFYAADRKDVSKFVFQPGAVPPPMVGPDGQPVPAAGPPPAEESRFNQLKAWVTAWNDGDGPAVVAKGLATATKLQVAAKEFAFARPGDDSIFRAAARVLGAARPYYTDGLIFTPNADPLPERPAATFMNQFKWKPPKDNTIDFLVVSEKVAGKKSQDKITTDTKPGTGETVRYKTMRLFVGGRTDNPRDVILNKRELPAPDRTYRGKGGRGGDYKPVVFIPKEFPDPMASICNLPVEGDPDTGEEYAMTEHSGEPIQDKTIVEMAYDPSQPPGWRWIPLRVRMDKTERLQRGVLSRTLNSEGVAEDVWNSIYDPISESMIKTGGTEPTAEEMAVFGGEAREREGAARRYFDRKGWSDDKMLVDGLLKFHNEWIKERILLTVGLSGEGKSLLDLACGVAGDLHKWRRRGAKFVIGLDYAAKNIMDTADSAYTRYMNVLAESGGNLDRAGTMVFAIADSSKPIKNGDAGSTEEEKNILRAVFGGRPSGPLPPYIEENAASRLKMGADCVSCMFAIHYFFESPEKFNGFLRNIADTLKVGGYFIGCAFDGEKVFELLRGVEKGESKAGMHNGAKIWNIRKEYDEEDIPEGDGAFGLPVDVQFLTIGMEHREYLVPFKVLEEKMALVGCELLSKDELAELGMVNSSATFDVSWDMAKKLGKTYSMNDTAKQYSFLNRWFIFKRKRAEAIATAVAAEAAAAVAAQNLGAAGSAAAGRPGTNAAGRAAANRNAAARSAAAAGNAAAAGTDAPQPPTAFQKAVATAENLGGAAPATVGAVPPAGRTVPVAPGPGAAPKRTYALGEIFNFYMGASLKDILAIGDKGAGRWLAPGAPFPIEDPTDKTKVYPSVEHFLAGMRVKLASDKPELAPALFGREGTIHAKFLADRLGETNGGTRQLPEDRDYALLAQEIIAVHDAERAPSLKKYKATVDEAKWATLKDATLREALEQRWRRDARLRKIVEAAREKGKTLLFFTPGATSSNLGGVRRNTGEIEGSNKVGKILMELAGFPA